jgi:predicted nucleic acid-binding protein
MSFVMVDTNVVSFLLKNDTRAALYEPHLLNKTPVISFMTLAELDRWALERNWGKNRIQQMEEHLRNFVVYPFERALCRKWAEVSAEAKTKGLSIECADAWIAATALLHNIPLITHNRRHFENIDGLSLISEA